MRSVMMLSVWASRGGEAFTPRTGAMPAATPGPMGPPGPGPMSGPPGMGGMVANATGVDAGMAADTLEGPWDDVMQDMHGMLRFLQGDRMLEVSWVASSPDRAGALRLAAAAVGRL